MESAEADARRLSLCEKESLRAFTFSPRNTESVLTRSDSGTISTLNPLDVTSPSNLSASQNSPKGGIYWPTEASYKAK